MILKKYSFILFLLLSLTIVQYNKIEASSDTEVNVLYDAQDEVNTAYKLKIIIEGTGKLINEATGAYVQSNDVVAMQQDQKLVFRILETETLKDVVYDNKHIMNTIEGDHVAIYGKGKDTVLRFIFKTNSDKKSPSIIPVVTGDKTNTQFFTILLMLAICFGAISLKKRMKE